MADSKYEVKMKTPRKITTRLRGVPDFSNAAQFNLYESGYEYVIVCRVPTFLQRLASKGEITEDGTSVSVLLNNFVTTIEQEEKGMSGFEDITAETMDITDGISTMQQISKITMQGGSTFNMTFTEKSGTPIVKLCDYYLRGIKDPRTQAKTYNGALDKGYITTPGFEKEVFTFMYINTDNTKKRIEKAFLLVNAQLVKAENSIYEATKGDIGSKDITLEINAFPIQGKQVNNLAQEMLAYLYDRTDDLKVILNSNDYDYFMTNAATRGFKKEGATPQVYQAEANTFDTLGTTEK